MNHKIEINEKNVYVNENKEYKGNHPLEENDHYENVLANMGIIEVGITGIEKVGHMLKISYVSY